MKRNADNQQYNAMNKESNYNRYAFPPDECELSISNRVEPNYANPLSSNSNSNSVINVVNSDTEQPKISSDQPRKNKQKQSEKSSNHSKSAGNIDTDQPNTSRDQSRKYNQRQSERGSNRSSSSYGKSRGNIPEFRLRCDQKQDENERIQQDRKSVIIAGDSMIQHVYGWEMSNSEVNVAVKSFSGANIDMKDFLQPIIRRSPDELILHIGTNNIRGSDSPEDLVAGISSLVSIINERSPNTKVTLSGLIIRRGFNLKSKIKSINNILKLKCEAIH